MSLVETWLKEKKKDALSTPNDPYILAALVRIPYKTVACAINKRYFQGFFRKVPRIDIDYDHTGLVCGAYAGRTIFLFLPNIVLMRVPVISVLAHEMIHATGISEHEEDFKGWAKMLARKGLPVSLGCESVLFRPNQNHEIRNACWVARKQFEALFK